ncbi:MAG TPA: SurA N-terminal domain-containing protein [Vicinamibacterales bacterium]|nr:SurA N-terminal domain-containing protein [Vicinamibacterales bacterium]
MRRSRLVVFLIALAGFAGGCQSKTAAPPVSADAWAVVNGREITRDDVERSFRRNLQAPPPSSEEETAAAKLEMLDQLVVQDLLLAKARELKIELPDTELDAAYVEARKDIPDESFKQELARRNLTAADMREGLRRDMLVQKLLEREVVSKVTVTDQEVTAFFEANRAQFNRTEDAYRIAQIVITPVRDARIANRTGNDATTPEEAAVKVRTVMDRLKGGAPFADVAADLSEDPESAPRGGDLGFVPVSALQQAPPALRDAVLNGTPGSARLLSGGGAHTVVLVLAKDPAGQKDLSMPEVKDAITQGLRTRREQLLRAAYLGAIRNDAVVVNLIARRLVESQGKLPSVAPAAPGTK